MEQKQRENDMKKEKKDSPVRFPLVFRDFVPVQPHLKLPRGEVSERGEERQTAEKTHQREDSQRKVKD